MATDYKLDDDLDIVIENGDLVRTACTKQAAHLVILTFIGSWKWKPFCGVGISRYKGSTGQNLRLKRELKVQLLADKNKDIDVKIRSFDDYYITLKREQDVD